MDMDNRNGGGATTHGEGRWQDGIPHIERHGREFSIAQVTAGGPWRTTTDHGRNTRRASRVVPRERVSRPYGTDCAGGAMFPRHECLG